MKRLRLTAGKAEINEYKIISSKIPVMLDGFKIAQISDLHSYPAHGVGEIIAEQKPDITVITGDIFDDDEKNTEESEKLVKELLEISPVYFVSGNHDEWRDDKEEVFKRLQDMGAKMLENEMVCIEKGDESIALFGVSDPISKHPFEISENLKENFSNLPEFDGYKILLFHRANLFDEIKNLGYDLILSGHMHGGQIIIPRLGGLLAPSSSLRSGKRMIFPEYCFGEVIWKDTTMLINRGLSNTLPVPRWGNRPEVTIVELRCK